MGGPNRAWRWLRRVLGVVALGYGVLCVAMFVLQDALLFHPTSIAAAQVERIEGSGAQRLQVPVGGATLRGFFVPAKQPGRRPTVLYFGGNAEPTWRRIDEHAWVGDAGFHRVYVPYRGYDESDGEPSAAALLGDALEIYDTVAARPDVDSGSVVVWGLSLGTGVAAYVAAKRDVAGVILLAPYDRLADVAAEHYPAFPVRWLMTNDIDTATAAAAIDAPALVIHGDADRVIPIAHGRRLAEAWRGPVTWQQIAGAGHNDLASHPAVRRAIADFLDAVVPR